MVLVGLRPTYTCAVTMKPYTRSAMQDRAARSLRDAFIRLNLHLDVDEKGYVGSFEDNLLPLVESADFEADLVAGDGNELKFKARAVHSSTILAVNCFAPFRRRISDLVLPNGFVTDRLEFERKCPIGLSRGTPPNLDVLLSGSGGVMGIECKFTEYLRRSKNEFAPAYVEQICDERCEQGYFREMLRIMAEPRCYAHLHAAQLIKHAFWLHNTFKGQPATLLYLYWEPRNPEACPLFQEHRDEIATFSERVAGDSGPNFLTMTYAELWSIWRENAPGWLAHHLDELSARYEIEV